MEAASLVTWLIYPLFPSQIYSTEFWHLARLNAELFAVIGIASPAIIILIIFGFLLLIMIQPFKDIVSRFVSGVLSRDAHDILFIKLSGKKLQFNRLLLTSSIILGVVVPMFPYIDSINPDGQYLGTDIPNYITWINDATGSDLADTLKKTMILNQGDRPLTLLLLISIVELGGFLGIPLIEVLKFIPIVLAPALSAAVYLFVKIATNNKNLAGVAALLTIVSYHFTVGIYAAFYANWFAIIAMYLAFALIAVYWKRHTPLSWTMLFAATLATLLLHSFTWTFLMACLVCFFIVSLFVESKRKRTLLLGIALVIVGNVLLDYSKSEIFGISDSFSRTIIVPETTLDLSEYFLRWNNLNATFDVYLGGLFTNSLLLVLALVWFFLMKYEHIFDRILVSSLAVGTLPLLFGDFVTQSRIFYDLPIHILAAVVLYKLIQNRNNTISRLLIVVIAFHFANYVIRALSNLYFISPF
ncbi:hypothetical protein [Candidatus Nitrososphaera sp. FF02]|uniref:hypothetical protein n=1 Tax=Candidatus Nitrososphaera sp. FF02 TaxID=3398226 RepID=UPI0039EB3F4F